MSLEHWIRSLQTSMCVNADGHCGLGSLWSHLWLTMLTWPLRPSARLRRGAELGSEGSHIWGWGVKPGLEEMSEGRIFWSAGPAG